jgi:hypothetical protein
MMHQFLNLKDIKIMNINKTSKSENSIVYNFYNEVTSIEEVE